MKRKVIGLLGLAVLLGAAWSARADDVVIGAQYPLSGPMASYSGPFLREGTLLALERINRDHLLGNGRTLKILIEDNAGDRNQAISLMNRFANGDRVTAVLGVYGSFLSLPAAPVANDLKVPLLAIAISDAIAKAGGAGSTAGGDAWVSVVMESASDDRVRNLLTELVVEPLLTAVEPDVRYAAAQLARLRVRAVDRSIAELKSRLQRVNPIEQSNEHAKLFAELVALEKRRRDDLEGSLGGG